MIIYVYSRGRLLDPSKLMLKSNLPRLAQQTGFLLDLLLACFWRLGIGNAKNSGFGRASRACGLARLFAGT